MHVKIAETDFTSRIKPFPASVECMRVVMIYVFFYIIFSVIISKVIFNINMVKIE